MSHLKRQKVPKNWPIERKGTKFVVRPSSNLDRGIPLLIVLRDILKLAKTRNEVKRAINTRRVLVNKKPVIEDKISLTLFDTLSNLASKKNYRINLKDNGKITVDEIEEKEANKKISRIINKTVLKKGKIQVNLDDGRNYLVDNKFKFNINDSALIDFNENKITKIIPLKENSKILVYKGKHAGKIGYIKKIIFEKKLIELETTGESKEKINVLISYGVAIE